MFTGYVILGKSINDINKVGELINNNKIMFMDYDEKNWTNVGVWITPEIFDEMFQKFGHNFDEYFIINPVVLENGKFSEIPQGKYEIWKASRIDNKLQIHN